MKCYVLMEAKYHVNRTFYIGKRDYGTKGKALGFYVIKNSPQLLV